MEYRSPITVYTIKKAYLSLTLIAIVLLLAACSGNTTNGNTAGGTTGSAPTGSPAKVTAEALEDCEKTESGYIIPRTFYLTPQSSEWTSFTASVSEKISPALSEIAQKCQSHTLLNKNTKNLDSEEYGIQVCLDGFGLTLKDVYAPVQDVVSLSSDLLAHLKDNKLDSQYAPLCQELQQLVKKGTALMHDTNNPDEDLQACLQTLAYHISCIGYRIRDDKIKVSEDMLGLNSTLISICGNISNNANTDYPGTLELIDKAQEAMPKVINEHIYLDYNMEAIKKVLERIKTQITAKAK